MGENDKYAEVPKDQYWDAQTTWCNELRSARREWDDFYSRGDKIIELYVDDRKLRRQKRFPLFNANVSILENALFARIPRPDVSRRFRDPDDPVGRVASLILQRALITEIEGDSSFRVAAKSMIKDMLVTGMGVGWVRYEVEADEVQITEDEDSALNDFSDASPVIRDQRVHLDYVHWKDFAMSPCRTFNECRWVARRVYMDKDAATKRFGERAEFLNYSSDPHNDENSNGSNEPENYIEPQAQVWEIWDKTTKKVYFICETSPSALDIQDDPLGLPDFFPTDKPLTANLGTSKFLPMSDYTVLQDQYNDLNETNSRISRLIKYCRLSGLYDSAQPAIKQLLDTANENNLIPADKFASFKETGGIKGAIDFLPLEQIVTTLGQLSAHRESLKQQIYELTGISDIIRGESNPYETKGAQQMKAQYSSIRLQGKQSEVAEYLTSQIQRLAYLICRFYEPDRLLERCGILPQSDQQYIQPALALLQNELMASLKLEVSTDALQQPSWARDQLERTQLITAVGQLLGQALPAAKEFPAIAPFLAHIVKLGVAGLQAGREVEGELDMAIQNMRNELAQPQPEKPDPAAMKLQADTKLAQDKLALDQQMAMQELELKKATAAGELALKRDVEMTKAQQKNMPFHVEGNMGLNEDDVTQALAQMQANIVQAQQASAEHIVAAITALANRPPEPVRIRVARDASGALVGEAT